MRRFWPLLRSLSVDARLDIVAATQRQFWPDWMGEQIREAAFVLVVASPAYRERGEDRGDRSVGKGVRWEARTATPTDCPIGCCRPAARCTRCEIFQRAAWSRCTGC